MDLDWVRRYCMGLPHTTETMQTAEEDASRYARRRVVEQMIRPIAITAITSAASTV